MELHCSVAALEPLTVVLDPDLPCYRDCDLVVEYAEALLAEMGPSLVMLYASLAGPPVTRDAFLEMVQPTLRLHLEHADRAAVLQQVREAYAPIRARARACIAALG